MPDHVNTQPGGKEMIVNARGAPFPSRMPLDG
jgi:hypothetical protein